MIHFLLLDEKRTSNKYGHLIRKKIKLRMIDLVRFDRQKSNNTLFIFTLASRGAVLVTSLLFAALRAEHCCTPVAPLRGVPGSVRYY